MIAGTTPGGAVRAFLTTCPLRALPAYRSGTVVMAFYAGGAPLEGPCNAPLAVVEAVEDSLVSV